MKKLFVISVISFLSIQIAQSQDDQAPIVFDYRSSLNMQLTEFCELPANKVSEVCQNFDKPKGCSKDYNVEACLAQLKIDEFGNAKKSEIIKYIQKYFQEIIVAILGIFATFIKLKLDNVKKRFVDPVFINKSKKNLKNTIGYGVNVVLIGLGGSGKTSIIRALTGIGNADPELPTMFNNLYAHTSEMDCQVNGEKIHRLIRVYYEDYKGQDQGELLNQSQQLGLSQREEKVPSTVFIYVVDIKPQPNPGKGYSITKTWNKDRIKKHTQEFSDAFISTNKEKVSKLNHVVLFINKIDLIEPMNREILDLIKKDFIILENRLRKAFINCRFSVIMGAASKGLGTCGMSPLNKNELTLRELIFKEAVQIQK